jgi:uncharacterized protein (TIGR00106 family)
MLIELTITPLGRGTHLSENLAGILEIIDNSGLRYALTPFGTCIEGSWDEVMAVVKLCHDSARSFSEHVFTAIRIEDDAGASNKLVDNVTAVENFAHRPLHREVLVQGE